MSDTDTDDLLLLPPDLYVNEQFDEVYAPVPYYSVVDDLITKIHRLEDRVGTMECNELDSARRYNSTDDLLRQNSIINSAYSTPQKPRTKYGLPELSLSSPRKMPGDVRKSPKSKIRFENDQSLNLKEVDQMLRHIQAQKSENECRLREKEDEYYSRMNANRCNDSNRRTTSSAYSSQNDDEEFECKVLKSIDPKIEQNFKRLTVSKLPSDTLGSEGTSSDNTQITAKWNQNYMIPKEQQKLLSLKELWGENSENKYQMFQEKLEEEKIKRQHCEQIIHELQSRALELQERLAVAVQVDQAKDKAIIKFHEAWEHIAERMESLNREKDSLESDLKELQLKSLQDLEECGKKINHYEKEASKALHLAHGNQEKFGDILQQNKEYVDQVQQQEVTIQELQSKHEEECSKNKLLGEIITRKELELNEANKVLTGSRQEVAHSKKAIELCQIEFTNMKTQYTQLELLLNDKEMQIKDLENQKRNFASDNENLKMLKIKHENELSKLKESNEKCKFELRNFYQEQVEIVVRDKLKEFQSQLDKAENSLEDELKKRELSIAQTAALHIKELSEKHNLEVNLLKEKHQEEINLYRVKVDQCQQHIEQMNLKVKLQDERKANIAKQLHQVMEAQWREALKIINSKTPTQDNTVDQLHLLQSRSHSNLDDVLSEKEDNIQELRCVNVNEYQDTPVSSKLFRSKKQIGNDLQNYVEMLLNKQSNGESSGEDKGNRYESDSKYQSRRHSKPPWK